MPVDRRVRAAAIATGLTLLISIFSVDYTVKPGDTLSEIARDTRHLTCKDLVAANKIPNQDLIHPGQVLFIPAKDVIHTVAKGESLYRIASKYGTRCRDPGQGEQALQSRSSFSRARNWSSPAVAARAPADRAVGSSGQRAGTPADQWGSSGTSGGTQGSGKYTRSGRYHVVERGQSLESIADLYDGVSADDIVAANGISNGRVYTGTRLYLDGPAFTATGSGGGRALTRCSRVIGWGTSPRASAPPSPSSPPATASATST